MGFGSTAKKVQKLADVADKTYDKINDLRDQLTELRGTVEETGDRVEKLERELEDQRALLEAIAEEHDVDVDGAAADAVIEDAEGEPVADERSSSSPRSASAHEDAAGASSSEPSVADAPEDAADAEESTGTSGADDAQSAGE
ncbi:DUF5798 family protein [Halomicrobium salinisoli]|uniref:DUF5798 family protein n=1 Tax=Halomicrobium salinisoli TaxID=2878391 RepID=UPI001CEFFC18|nr:DUF5798 family protein [Halomicrobium salinisoli]